MSANYQISNVSADFHKKGTLVADDQIFFFKVPADYQILTVPGVRDIIMGYVVDPREMHWWDFEPPSFFPMWKCPHILGERLCREILKLRTRYRLTAVNLEKNRRRRSFQRYIGVIYVGCWSYHLRHVCDTLRQAFVDSPRYIRYSRAFRRFDRLLGPWRWLSMTQVSDRVSSLKKKRKVMG
jgi:hypothetical protein